MKRIILSLALAFGFSLTMTPTAQAQGISEAKKVISALNDFDGSAYGLNKEETEEVKGINGRLINSTLSIIGGKDSSSEKKTKLQALKQDAEKQYRKVLKGKGPIKQFQKDMKKKIRPFKRKMKLIGLVF